MQTDHQHRKGLRRGARSNGHLNRRYKETKGVDRPDGTWSRLLAPVVQLISTRSHPDTATEKLGRQRQFHRTIEQGLAQPPNLAELEVAKTQPGQQKETAMTDDTPRRLGNVITIGDERIESHLDRVVRGSVEETLKFSPPLTELAGSLSRLGSSKTRCACLKLPLP